ncbi:MAG: hypothetical protein JXQ96_13190 [Cyclobacteriaceae bacterium]
MKYLYFTLVSLVHFTAVSQQTVLSGVYQGKNLYIQNPYLIEENKFCIDSISINQKNIDLNMQHSAINLNFENEKLFAPVLVLINHKNNCKPRIINPDAIRFHSTFRFDSLVARDGLLMWYSKGEKTNSYYCVEKLFGTNWQVVSTVKSKEIFEGTNYEYQPEIEQGGNIFRIKYALRDGRHLHSNEIQMFHFENPITFSPKSVKDKMTLSRHADYQIMDMKGNIVASGSGKIIPLRKLKMGDYKIYLEGETESSAATYVFNKK